MQALLNTSNLHVGGGIQVAASVLSEIIKSDRPLPGLTVSLSTEVESALRGKTHLSNIVEDVIPLNVRGLDPWNRKARKLLNRHDCVFTLFGPLYRWNPPFKSIVGFAQPWIIYPHNECYAMMPLFQRLKTRLKFWVHAQFFKRADVLVVELDHVKAGLVRELGINPSRIHVIHNCLSALYLDNSGWGELEVPSSTATLRLGFVGRNYLHKNTSIFPKIVASLRARHGVEAKFYVTFTEPEWNACTPEFRDACINVGPLRPDQCPNFYRAVDAVVFPSLLECFSATPLESMAMEKPLFASDRPFNRDVCGRHASYFDPLSADHASDTIAEVFRAHGPSDASLRAARDHALSFSSPADRAEKYLKLLAQVARYTQKR